MAFCNQFYVAFEVLNDGSIEKNSLSQPFWNILQFFCIVLVITQGYCFLNTSELQFTTIFPLDFAFKYFRSGGRRKKRKANKGGPKQDPSLITEKYFAFLFYYMTLNDQERIAIGHNLTSLFRDCSFAGTDCLNDRWSLSQSNKILFPLSLELVKTFSNTFNPIHS